MEKKHQYLITDFEWVGSNTYRKTMVSCKGIQLIYEILRRYVIRDNMDNVIGKYIYENYYNKNLLASSVTYDYLQEKTGLGRALISKCIKNLTDAGFIKEVSKVKGPNGDLQNVFLLGKRKNYIDSMGMSAYKDFWFTDDVVAEEILESEMDLVRKSN